MNLPLPSLRSGRGFPDHHRQSGKPRFTPAHTVTANGTVGQVHWHFYATFAQHTFSGMLRPGSSSPFIPFMRMFSVPTVSRLISVNPRAAHLYTLPPSPARTRSQKGSPGRDRKACRSYKKGRASESDDGQSVHAAGET